MGVPTLTEGHSWVVFNGASSNCIQESRKNPTEGLGIDTVIKTKRPNDFKSEPLFKVKMALSPSLRSSLFIPPPARWCSLESRPAA